MLGSFEIDRADMDKIVQNLSDYYRFNRRGIQLIRDLRTVSSSAHGRNLRIMIRAALETRRSADAVKRRP